MEMELKEPIGWPPNEPFPVFTVEQTEKVVRETEELIVRMLDDLKGKISGPTPEMLHAIIVI